MITAQFLSGSGANQQFKIYMSTTDILRAHIGGYFFSKSEIVIMIFFLPILRCCNFFFFFLFFLHLIRALIDHGIS